MGAGRKLNAKDHNLVLRGLPSDDIQQVSRGADFIWSVRMWSYAVVGHNVTVLNTV